MFAAADLENLIEWVRRLPLIIRREEGLLVHVGIMPSWSIEKTVAYAAEIEVAYAGMVGDFLVRHPDPVLTIDDYALRASIG